MFLCVKNDQNTRNIETISFRVVQLEVNELNRERESDGLEWQ